MEYRELGATGVMIPEVGLGTWKYRGGPEPLRRGIELGANLIDTAEMYRTEDAVGQAIRGIRDRVFVATKVLGSNLRYDDVLRAAEKSLRLLDDPVIDLYQIHWPSRSVPISRDDAGYGDAGGPGRHKVYRRQQLLGGRYAGGPGRDVQVPHRLQPGAVQPEAAAHRARHDPLLRREPHHGDGLHTAGRRLAGRAPHELRAGREWETLESVAREAGKTPAQVALNWCLTRAPVVVIPKTNSVARTEENCGASGWKLTEGQVARLEAAFPV